ncbi:universal stress protein [Mucilaginibacter sp. UR6-11]|uniref:universal stress protein n=1 Tax=Mucilaginibacter sp. UR6-11 TaxID=1435644 RepID=UPI001E346CAB|nr:universal stress protein [Mucilaginibacter sp. UR6-11]MCC8426420.1 universal stress protein [Mucilaginibacter sp. UR6-11]
MRKILLAIDATKLDQKSLEFGCYLAQLTGSALTGVFLKNTPAEEPPGVKFAYGNVYVETIDTRELPETRFREQACEENIRSFESICEGRVAYNIRRDDDRPLEALITESRFADMLVIAPSAFSTSPLEQPSAFVREILARAECPVIISPYYFDEIKTLYLAYDGQQSSVFAIKQFTYLFPELRDKKITVLQANENADFKAEDKEKIYEYLKAYYPEIAFHDLAGKPDNELFDLLLREKDAFVVMGAYGRSRLSNFFRHSTAESLLKVNGLPLFITHH